ncbi:hypothetical protein CFRS1_v015366 [Colletotrichum fructicola]|nr:hypothetical protein CFRS1_v015366 [Colletotrichum fructicola]
METRAEVPLAISKRLVLIHVERRVECEYERLTEPASDDGRCLVRHRHNREIAVCRLTWLQSLEGIGRIAHRNIAAIHGIFHESQAVFLVHERLEVDLQDLAITDEIHVASVLSQVIEGIHHVVAEKIRFPLESICVTRCGVVKIVLNVCFQPAVDIVSDAERYWSRLYGDVLLWIRSQLQGLGLSFAARDFLSKSHERTLPGIQHQFLTRSKGPDGLFALVAQALETKETVVLDRARDNLVPCDLVTRMWHQPCHEQQSVLRRR